MVGSAATQQFVFYFSDIFFRDACTTYGIPVAFQVCFWGGHVPVPNPRISLKIAAFLQ
jgi:hypothetical protein